MMQIIGGQYEFSKDDASLLGAGGMGKVFRGRHTQTGQTVAIKELKAEVVKDNPEHVERFIREAEALSRLNHPNMVNVLAAINENGTHYIVMDYVPGGSLYDLLDEHPRLPIDRVLQIALDLSDALTRAHRLRIIHRDIKPANVLLAADGTPRLTDFGVARMDDKTGFTQTGTVVGTLNYLSPEALNGFPIDERADIWAFGVMLYEMLAGRRPFEEETTGAVISAILTRPVPDLQESRPEVPAPLAALVNSMLEKDPDQRISSVRKVGLELENLIRGVDSDEIVIDSELREAIAASPEESRFATSTSDMAFKVAERMSDGITRVMDDKGEEFYVVPRAQAGQRFVVAGIAGALLVVVIIALAYFFLGSGRPRPETPAPAQDAIASVAPVDDDEYMVLVAQIGRINGEERPMQTVLMEGLIEQLERDISYSNIRVRQYDEVILGSQQAVEVAEAVGAAVIVWGGYGESGVDLVIQVGSLAPFTTNGFEREALERIANVAIKSQSEMELNITPLILGMLGTLHTADGNVFELMRIMAMLEQTPLEAVPSLATSGADEDLYRFFANYLTDTEAAAAALDEAIREDGGNAMLYVLRGLARTRLGEIETAADDIVTAQRIGPEGWAAPLLLQAVITRTNEEFSTLIQEAIEARPDDWFFHSLLAGTYYETQDLDGARAAAERSLALNPQANYPYIQAVLIAMREGRLTDVGRYMQQIVQQFPDPYFGNRVLTATFGEDTGNSFMLYAAFGNLLIGQYSTALENTEAVVANSMALLQDDEPLAQLPAGQGPVFYISDLALLRGLAQCNLDNTEAALVSYSLGTRLQEDYHMLRLLRAEIYSENGNATLANREIEMARGLSEEMDQMVEDAVNGMVSCENFFDYFIELDNTQQALHEADDA